MKKRTFIILLCFCILLVLSVLIMFKYRINSAGILNTFVSNITGEYSVNTSIQIKVELEDTVSGTDPNIIKAARAALYNFLAYSARYQDYNYKTVQYMKIFDVKKIGENLWTVYYRTKTNPAEKYDERFFSTINVSKDAVNNFEGEITFSTPEEH